MKKGFRVVHSHRSFDLGLLIALVAITVSLTTQNIFAQGMPSSNGASGLAATGEQTAQKLQQEGSGKNKFRVDAENGSGGVRSEAEVLENMRKLFDKIYLKPEQAMMPKSDLDEWFSPHLRDLDISEEDRILEVLGPTGRAMAGSPSAYSWYGCTGACPWCKWEDEHRSYACCGVSTAAYGAMIQDTNFKACCVRQEDETSTMEDIACKHPNGDGWAGLFEYYFPTNAIGWESQRGTTMIATRDSVKRCMDSSDKLMENSDWVAGAVERGAELEKDLKNKEIKETIKKNATEALNGIRPNNKSLRFTDSLQGGGLTMRVNFAHMDPMERRALAVQFCMHPDQFMKLMDPQYDRKQMRGGPTLQALQALPIWANYCPEAVKLMTDPNETFKVQNTDGTKTNFPQGMAVFTSDPLYCQKMSAMANPIGGEFLLTGVLAKQGLGLYTEQSVGYTCRTGNTETGGFSTRMVPVTLNSTAKIDPRTLDHAIPFMHAAGYYKGEMSSGLQSIYKRFEPLPYSKQVDLFTGKRWKGGGLNEMNMPCRSYEGKDYEGQDQPDQLFISDVNHKPFTQEKVQEFNKYDREAADEQPENFHNRGFNENVLNYAAAFRIFATCPAGYVRWRGPHSEKFTQACGKENFGGMPERQ